MDLGRLDEAEQCLEKSLTYDPESEVAVNEMEYIRQLRAKETAPGGGVIIRRLK